MSFKTAQEEFWAGEFGTDYIQRNTGPELLASNLGFFCKALARAARPASCIEFGANLGLNLQAISTLRPEAALAAVEINGAAANKLRGWGKAEVFEQSILDFEPSRAYDLALIKGVLIHINPDELPTVYDKLYASSGRYICTVEYYNPAPVAIPYRGHTDRLFKRDFAGEILDRFPDLKVVDYGFCWHRDPNFPQDDVTWFLLEKTR